MKQLNRNPLFNSVSFALTGSVVAATLVIPLQAQAQAQESDAVLEEVIVTATKRAESLQDIPLSVQVLSERMLDNLGVKGFEDFIQYMPTVSYTSDGPGYGILYMRGIASGGDGVHSGSMPSVGFYLDEQPVTTINQILDVHIYDIARIATLSGPQGTLFGQGSQAGTIRIITNKPIADFFEASYDVYANVTESGDPGYGVDGMVNLPLGENMAVRLVAWHKKTGGYIDNVYSVFDYDNEGIIRDNADVVQSNFNEAEVSGLRAQLKIDLNDNWSLTPGLNYQTAEADGLWRHNPKYVGDLQIARFFPDWADEDWYQASLTLEGDIGDMNLVYAGAYLDRDLDTSYDYTTYSEYRSDYYAYYEYACYVYDPNGDCADPSQFITGDENFTRMSHELRLQSSADQRLRWIAGLFYQRQEHLFDLQWIIPLNAQSQIPQDPAPGAQQSLLEGFSANQLSILLTGYDIHSEGRVWLKFLVRNDSNDDILFRFQDSYIEVTDNLGTIYEQDEDFLLTQKQFLLRPEETYELKTNDYPNNTNEIGLFYGMVPEEAEYLIVTIKQFNVFENLQWVIPLK